MLFQEFLIAANKGSTVYNVGDRNLNSGLHSANSARVTLNNHDAGVIKPFLLAADHPAVPTLGFAPKYIKLVWNFETPSFTTATILFRYDEISARDASMLRLMRYNLSAQTWVRVPIVWESSGLRFTASNLPPLGASNLGFFALVELPAPTLFLVK